MGHETKLRAAQAAPKTRRGFSAFLRERRGNIAMTFGLAAIPLCVAAGTAVDLSQALIVRQRLSHALDAAGLAVGRAVGLTQPQMEVLAQDFFNANYPAEELGTPSVINLSVEDNRIRLTATAEVQTAIMRLVGIDTLDVGASAEITRESKGLELALVLDTTGSMAPNGKIEALRDASSDLVNILFGDSDFPELLRIGIVPFTQAVRLDPTDAVNSGWIDTTGQSSVAQLNFDGGKYAYNVYTSVLSNTPWAGCVEARPNGLDETDTPPSAGDPETRWVPYFQPDEPDSGTTPSPNSYTHRYRADGTTSNDPNVRQRRWQKYSNRTWAHPNGPHQSCTMQTVTPLTNDKVLLLQRLSQLNADGWTHIPLGLSWGWRVLSPGEPFTQGSAYDDEDFIKALVLMTDGENTMPSQNSHNGSRYTAYGYANQGRLGPTSASGMANEMDNILARVCDNVKDLGVRVYTIGFQITDQTTLNLLEDCATEPDLFFDSPTNEELQQAFETIAADLSNLRISD